MESGARPKRIGRWLFNNFGTLSSIVVLIWGTWVWVSTWIRENQLTHYAFLVLAVALTAVAVPLLGCFGKWIARRIKVVPTEIKGLLVDLKYAAEEGDKLWDPNGANSIHAVIDIAFTEGEEPRLGESGANNLKDWWNLQIRPELLVAAGSDIEAQWQKAVSLLNKFDNRIHQTWKVNPLHKWKDNDVVKRFLERYDATIGKIADVVKRLQKSEWDFEWDERSKLRP